MLNKLKGTYYLTSFLYHQLLFCLSKYIYTLSYHYKPSSLYNFYYYKEPYSRSTALQQYYRHNR